MGTALLLLYGLGNLPSSKLSANQGTHDAKTKLFLLRDSEDSMRRTV